MNLRYRRHPLVWVGLVLLTLSILARWLLPRFTNIPEIGIQITATVAQGVATACIILGIIKGGRRAQQEQSLTD